MSSQNRHAFEVSLSFSGIAPRRYQQRASYNRKTFPRKRGTSFLSSVVSAIRCLPYHRAPLTRQGLGLPYGSPSSRRYCALVRLAR